MIENAPRTFVGQAAVSAAASAGVWRWGAMGGLAGIDWQAAHIVHGDATTWPEVKEALRFYEAGATAGAAERAKSQDHQGGGGERARSVPPPA